MGPESYPFLDLLLTTNVNENQKQIPNQMIIFTKDGKDNNVLVPSLLLVDIVKVNNGISKTVLLGSSLPPKENLDQSKQNILTRHSSLT